MARYTGPRGRRVRRLFVALTHLSGKDPEKDPALRRPYPPGQHGQTQRFKPSNYGLRLLEKQKLKLAYELLERQFRKYVQQAKGSGGNAGNELLMLLEMRFDAMVFRSGMATSVRQARQFVRHGYFTVDGKKVNYPSTALKPGSVVELIPRLAQHPLLVETRERTQGRFVPGHIQVSAARTGFTVVRKADDAEPPITVDITKVIELYA